jgi:hypothetical protein
VIKFMLLAFVFEGGFKVFYIIIIR